MGALGSFSFFGALTLFVTVEWLFTPAFFFPTLLLDPFEEDVGDEAGDTVEDAAKKNLVRLPRCHRRIVRQCNELDK